MKCCGCCAGSKPSCSGSSSGSNGSRRRSTGSAKARSCYPATAELCFRWTGARLHTSRNRVSHVSLITCAAPHARRGGSFMTHIVRMANVRDPGRIARLVNTAFQVEAFFKIGDRTSEHEIRALMATGEFLVIDDDTRDSLAACIFTSIEDTRGYFGMLSVDPSRQGRGLGRALIDAAETRARARGCDRMD